MGRKDFSAVCEYYESKARTQLSHAIRLCELGCNVHTFCCSEWVFSISLELIKKQSNIIIHSAHHSLCGIQLHKLHETCRTEATPRMWWRHGQVLSATILSWTLTMNSVVIVESVPVAFSRAPMSLWALLWNSWLCLAVVSLSGRLLGTVCTVKTSYVN